MDTGVPEAIDSSQSHTIAMDTVGPEVPDAEELVGDETYALRNPWKETQPIRKRQYTKKSDAEKEVAKMRRKRQEEINGAYRSELADLQAYNKERMQEISKKYNKSEKKTRDSVLYSSTIKGQRKPSLFQAAVHDKRTQLNDGLAVGDRHSLVELQELVKGGEGWEKVKAAMPEEEKQRLLQQLSKERELKQTGARANNKSSTRDVYNVTKWVHKEVTNASMRTGLVAAITMGRGHMNDTYVPSSFETENCKGFYKQSLGYNPTEVMARIECFASSFKQGQMSIQNKAALRKECAAKIGEGLELITGIKGLAMNYKSYKKIVARYRVKIVGWPATVPFVNPSQISVEELRRLRDALLSKACTWERMSAGELAEFLAEVDNNGGGGTLGPKRKERSDKGKKRKQVSASDKVERQRKRAKKAANQFPPHISPDFVDSNSEDEDSDLHHHSDSDVDNYDSSPVFSPPPAEWDAPTTTITPDSCLPTPTPPSVEAPRVASAEQDAVTTTFALNSHLPIPTPPSVEAPAATYAPTPINVVTESIPTHSQSTSERPPLSITSTNDITTNARSSTTPLSITSDVTTNARSRSLTRSEGPINHSNHSITSCPSTADAPLGLLETSTGGRQSARINGRRVLVFNG